MLYREPKLLKDQQERIEKPTADLVSVLYREPKLLKGESREGKLEIIKVTVSVLYREPKLLKGNCQKFTSLRV